MSNCKACEDICSTCLWNGKLSCGYLDVITVVGCPGCFEVLSSDDDKMRTVIKPDKYYLGHRYLVIIISDDIFLEYFFNYDDAKECQEKYCNSEIFRILPFK